MTVWEPPLVKIKVIDEPPEAGTLENVNVVVLVSTVPVIILPNEKLRVLILVLHGDYQKKGIGKELMEIMTKESEVFGIKKVTLEVRKDSDAITFYRKLGFSSVDVLPCYYQDGCDGIVMEKQL